MKKIIYLMFLLIATSGCASPKRLTAISIGMSKSEVISHLGTPSSIAAEGDTEFLNYQFRQSGTITLTEPYFVKLVGGRVVSYGKLGDFNSTKNPTNDINIQQR